MDDHRHPEGHGHDTPDGYDEGVSHGPGYVADKQAVKRRLARIRGQIEGISRMVDEEAYCIDVLTQIAAVSKALDGVALALLTDHTNHCVRGAVEGGGAEAAEMVDELLSAVERFGRTR